MTLTIFCKLHLERNQTLLQFVNVARAPYLKHDANGSPFPDRTKGMIFFRPAKTPRTPGRPHHGQDQRFEELSYLVDAIQILARRYMSQVSSSFPSYDDATTLSTMMGATMSTTNSTTPRSKSRSWPVCWRISRRAEWGRARVSGEARKAGARVSPVVV